MLQAEFIRDMHNNYLVLKGIEGNISGYVVKMLLNNSIQGILKIEQRCMDQIVLYYYDITSLKLLSTIYENKSLNYIEIKNLLSYVLETIDHSKEFLLSEDDFIIEPNYIFIDPSTQTPKMCFLVGYQEKIQLQICRFIEYLMNKVDYKDEQAVLLIYALYKESREMDCTFDKLTYVLNHSLCKTDLGQNNRNLNEKLDLNSDNKNTIKITNFNEKKNTRSSNIKDNNFKNENNTKTNTKIKNNITNNIKNHTKNNIKNSIANQHNKHQLIDKEKIVEGKNSTAKKDIKYYDEIHSEQEIQCFAKKTYILAVSSIVGGLVLFIAALQLKVLHNVFGNHIDTVKVLCCITMICSTEIFIMIKLFDSKNKITRMETNIEYMDSIQSEEEQPWNEKRKFSHSNLRNKEIKQETDEEMYEETNKEMYEEINEGINENTNEDIDEYMNEETMLLWINEDNMEQDKTVILAELTPKISYCLEPCKANINSTILVQAFPFIIGKAQNDVDFTLQDNSISRRHAKLVRDDDTIYLIDLSSTNGTYLNGTKITEYKRYKLMYNDEITFSNLKYIWKVNE